MNSQFGFNDNNLKELIENAGKIQVNSSGTGLKDADYGREDRCKAFREIEMYLLRNAYGIPIINVNHHFLVKPWISGFKTSVNYDISSLPSIKILQRIDVSEGIIVIPKNTKLLFRDKKFKIFYSGHPLPDGESVKAGKYVLDFINNCSKHDFVLFLVSGGGSSLLALPDKITLNEKKRVTKLLLECGATIDEFNCCLLYTSDAADE